MDMNGSHYLYIKNALALRLHGIKRPQALATWLYVMSGQVVRPRDIEIWWDDTWESVVHLHHPACVERKEVRVTTLR